MDGASPSGLVKLAVHASPPLHHPVRFFLTAPLFGIAAGCVLLLEPTAWTSRWMPATLAAVHLVTVGVMLMVMAGALFQVVPVLQARPVACGRVAVPVVHLTLSAGAVALAVGLRRIAPAWLFAAVALVSTGVLALLLPVAVGLARKARGGSVPLLRFAVLGLVVTVALSGWLAAGLATPDLGFPVRAWTDVHAGFGLGGWTLLLVAGVAFQVIPQFHVTPPFPRRLVVALGATVFLALVALSHARGTLARALATVAVAAAASWAILALCLLRRSRRRQADTLLRFWLVALGALLTACAVLLASWWVLPPVEADRAHLLAGVLLIAGFALSAIVGMQHQIFAFLLFMHLQPRALKLPIAQRSLLPTMEGLVPPRISRVQFAVHGTMVALAVAGVLWPPIGWAGATLLLADFAVLAAMQWTAIGRYRRAARAMARAGG